MLDYLKSPVQTYQDFLYLAARSLRNVTKKPIYWNDILMQMDLIGVGSLTVNNSNSYTLGTVFNGGTLNLGNSNALGNGSLTIGAGTAKPTPLCIGSWSSACASTNPQSPTSGGAPRKERRRKRSCAA